MDKQIIRRHSDRFYSIKSNRYIPNIVEFLYEFSEEVFSYSTCYISIGLEIDQTFYDDLLDECDWFETNEHGLQDVGIFKTPLGEIYIFPRKHHLQL